MSVLNNANVDPNISSTKTYKNLTLQDALIAIAVYAAQIDPDNPKDNIRQIENLAKKNSLFKGESNEISDRILKFVSLLRNGNPMDIVEIAAMSLTAKYKQMAFEWAVELVCADKELSEEQNEILDWLRIKLSIDSHVANKIIHQKSKSR